MTSLDIFWIFAAFVSGVAARLLRLPSLVGFLVAGMVLSRFGATSGPVLEELGSIGVALLLFTVGLDLNLKTILRSEILGAGGIHMLVATLLAAGGAMLIGIEPAGALVLGAALAVSSIILAAKTLEERDELGSYHGRVAIGILLLQTVIMGIVLAFVGGSTPSPWAFALVGLLLLRPVLALILVHLNSRELVLLFGLLLAMGGAFLFETVGLSGELGALTAGAILAGTEGVERLTEKLWGLKEAFLAAFFLRVGLAGIPEGSDLGLVIALLVFLLVKGGMYFGMLTLFRLKARTAFMTSVALTSFSGILLIVGVLAAEAGLIPATFISVLAAATAGSYVINAVATRYSLVIWRRTAKLLSIVERDVKHRSSIPRTLGHSEYLIIGMGRAGIAAYERLTATGHCVTGMDYDPSKLAEQRAWLRRVVYFDGRDKSMWQQLDLSRIRGVVLGVPGTRSKLEVTRAMRDAGFKGTISALTADTVEQAELIAAGASAVHLARDQAGRALADHVASVEYPSAEPEVIGLDLKLESDSA